MVLDSLLKSEQNFFNELIEIEKYDRLSKLNVEETISIYSEINCDAARSVTAMLPKTSQSRNIEFANN